jgi:hypothetical protein
MRKLTCEPGTEVNGATVLSLIENMQSADIAPYLSKYKLENIQEDHWYPLENMQGLLNELHNRQMTPSFVAIGMSIAEVALMPPHLEHASLGELLENWNEHYQINHRYGNIGRKITEKIDEHHYKLTLDGGVYPDDFEYGVVYGFAKRFLPVGTKFTVWYEDGVKRLDQGGTQTVIHIIWE